MAWLATTTVNVDFAVAIRTHGQIDDVISGEVHGCDDGEAPGVVARLNEGVDGGAVVHHDDEAVGVGADAGPRGGHPHREAAVVRGDFREILDAMLHAGGEPDHDGADALRLLLQREADGERALLAGLAPRPGQRRLAHGHPGDDLRGF